MRERIFSFNLSPLYELAEEADRMLAKYDGLELSEVAALEHIGLVYTEDLEQGSSLVYESSGGPFILLDPLLSRDKQFYRFFMSLAMIRRRERERDSDIANATTDAP